jgi:hypothetical protein
MFNFVTFARPVEYITRSAYGSLYISMVAMERFNNFCSHACWNNQTLAFENYTILLRQLISDWMKMMQHW